MFYTKLARLLFFTYWAGQNVRFPYTVWKTKQIFDQSIDVEIKGFNIFAYLSRTSV